MAPVNADNPSPRAAPAAPAPSPEPSGSLEDRIDSLLSEMQESLEEIDRSNRRDGPGASPRPAPAKHRAKAPTSDNDLAAALDAAVAQAETVLDDKAGASSMKAPEVERQATPALSGAASSGVPDPESHFEPPATPGNVGEPPATTGDPGPTAGGSGGKRSAPPDRPTSGADDASDAPPIEALDEELARQAEALADEPEPVVDRGAGASPPESAAPASAMASTPAPAQGSAPPKPKAKAKIAVRKRGEPASDDAGAWPEEAPSPMDDDCGAVAAPAVAPVAAGPLPGAGAGVPVRVLEAIARPLRFVPPHVRDYIGWFALLTAFNAACVWTFWLLLRA